MILVWVGQVSSESLIERISPPKLGRRWFVPCRVFGGAGHGTFHLLVRFVGRLQSFILLPARHTIIFM